MRKIGKIYIVTESELDEINYKLDWYFKYKAMSEIDWEELDHEEHSQADL